MNPLILALFGKRVLRFFAIFIFILSFSPQAKAQLIPGFRANGRPMNQGDTVTICIGSLINYVSTAQGYSLISWRFALSSTNTSTLTNPSVVYNAGGLDTTWQVITSGTNRDSMYILVQVNTTKPVAGFTFLPDSMCGNVSVNFTNTSSGNNLNYLWTFEPGRNSVVQNPTYPFLNAIGATGYTTYPVKLVVTNDQVCKDSITKPVTVKRIPDASIDRGATDFTYTVFNGVPTFRKCDASQFFQFRFINISTTPGIISGYTIKWGDGTPDSSFTAWPVNTTIIAHTFPRGQSSMQIIATGNNGCVGIKNYNVFIGNTPAGGILTPGNTAVCNNAPFNQLTFPINGTSPNSIGNFYVITVNDGSPQVTYQHPPPSSYTHTFTTTSCGTTSTDGTGVYPNAFSVNMTISNPCTFSGSTVTPIPVSGKPKAQIVAPQNVCTGSVISIYSSSNFGNVVSNGVCTNNGKLVWSISPSVPSSSGSFGNLGSLNNPVSWQGGTQFIGINFTQAGTYSIKLYVANDADCGIDSITKTICVRLPPTAAFTMDKHEGCAPDTVATTNTSPVGTCLGETYNWSVAFQDVQNCGTGSGYNFISGTNASTRDAKIRFSTPGRYIISLTESAIATGCVSAVYRDTIFIKAKPKVTINTLTAVCIGNPISPTATVSACYSNQALTYNWTFTNGNPASSNTLIPGSILYNAVSNYPISLAVENECGITTATATASITNVPVANAGPDKSICSGIPTPIGVSTGNYTYSWSPATGLSNPNIAVPTATLNYTGVNADTVLSYVLTTAAGSNCSSKDTVLITIKRKPVVTITPASAAICSGQSITLIATGASSYVWAPAGNLNVNNLDTIIASPAVSTTYTVTGTLNGCTATAPVTVTVTPLVIVNAGSDSLVCNSSSAVQFTGTPAGGTWSGNTNLTTGGLFNANAAGNGTYTLYYTAGAGNCTSRDSILVTVVSAATANAGADFAICQQPGSIQLNGLPLGGTWSGSPLVTTLGILSTNTPGTYTLIYRIGSGSCIARDTIVITVNNGITNNIIATNQSVCLGAQPSQIIGQVISGGNGSPVYQWQSSTDSLTWINIPGATLQNYLPPTATQTIFYRRLASTALCSGLQGNTSLPVKIIINPDAQAVFNPTTIKGCVPFVITPAIINLTAFNAAVIEYRWYVNNNYIGSGQNFPGYTMMIPGDSITVKLVAISRFGCKNDSTQHGFTTVLRPVPAFIQSDSVGCGPVIATFTNNTPNIASYTYSWDFGNGQTSALSQPSAVTFPPNPLSGDTVYTVRFKTFSQCDTITLLRYVRVKSKPKALFTPDRSTGCSSYDFTFTNTSRGNGNTYVWDFGDGSPLLPTNAAQVHHVFRVGSTTTFQVKLKATNECGTDSLIYNLVVTPISIRLDFAINGNDRYGCLPHTVKFINNSQGGSVFNWSFGDGATLTTTSNVDTVTHTYTTAGTFTATLRGTNSCSDTSDIELVTVQLKPAVSFTATPLIACTNDTIRFSNLSDTGLSFNWRFGDGSFSNLRTPVKIYTTAGLFRIWLTGTKAYPSGVGCSDSAFKDVVIRDTLPGSFTASTQAASCVPVSISFVNDNRPAAATTWAFGDGSTATGDSVNHTYNQAGTYIVKMISRGLAGCTYSATKTIIVTGLSGTLLYNSGYLCPGIPLRMEVISPNAPLIRYVFGNGDSLTTMNTIINYTYPQPGVYIPYAYIISNSCVLRLTRGDTVKVDRLRTGFRTAAQQSCGRTVVSFTDTSNAFFGIRNWLWDFGDGTTSTQQNPVKTYTQNGTYSVRLRITGNSNCVDTITIPLTVAVHNYPVSTIAGDTVACIGQPLALTAIVQSADPVASYNWDFGNGTNGSGQSTIATYNTGGNYTIRLISRTAFGCADTVYKTVRANVSPVVSAGPDVTICRGQSIQIGAAGATTWQWSPLQGLSCTTCSNPVASPLFTSNYIVTGSFGALCKANDTIQVRVIQPFNMAVSPTTTVCIGDSVPLFATGAYTYAWSPATSLNNANISNPTAKPTATTLYQVVGKDNFNCFTDTDYVRVNVGQYPMVDLGNGTTVVAGTVLTLNPTITNGPVTRYRWTPPADLSCANCPRPVATINNNISYKLEVENAFGCVGSDTINFKVNCDPNQLFIPNAFSPDGDGTNDVLMVRGKGISMVKYFRVFNRWGQLVFERNNVNVNDPQQGWNGNINGVPAQPDVYVYTAEAVCSAGGTFVYKGNVTLVR